MNAERRPKGCHVPPPPPPPTPGIGRPETRHGVEAWGAVIGLVVVKILGWLLVIAAIGGLIHLVIWVWGGLL